MEFKAESRDLRAAVDACRQAALSGGPSLSTNGQVLLRAEDGFVEVVGVNVKSSTTVRVKATTKIAGVVGLDCKALSAQLRHVPGEAHMIVEKGMCALKSTKPRRSFRLAMVADDHFPRVHEPNGETLVLPAETIATLIGSTAFSIDMGDDRVTLHNALLEVGDGWVSMVTSDGHRLTRMQCEADVPKGEDRHVPRGAVAELARMAKLGEDITLTFSPAYVFAAAGSQVIAHAVSDAQFPSYASIVPPRSNTPVRVERGVLTDALKAAAAVRKDGAVLKLAKDALTVTATDGPNAESSEELAVEYAGKDAIVGINTTFLLEALAAAPGDAIELDVCGELDPVGVYGGEGFTAVVMPMRV